MTRPSKATRTDYIQAGGVGCLYCGSREIDLLGEPREVERSTVRRQVQCCACSAVWYECYRMSHVLTAEEAAEEDARLGDQRQQPHDQGQRRPAGPG